MGSTHSLLEGAGERRGGVDPVVRQHAGDDEADRHVEQAADGQAHEDGDRQVPAPRQPPQSVRGTDEASSTVVITHREGHGSTTTYRFGFLTSSELAATVSKPTSAPHSTSQQAHHTTKPA